MRKIEIPYYPRPLQKKFDQEAKRFNVCVMHRRAGKTVMAINHLLKRVLKNKRPNAQGAYIAPTYSSAKRIAWQMLREYAGVIPGVRFNEAELRCDLPDGKRIWLLGAESPDSLRGLRLDMVILDEYADMNSRLYPEIIRPAVSDYGDGEILWIGTPRGENQFKTIYDHALLKMQENDPEWYAMRFPASETGIIPQKELDAARETMDESQYLQEYEVSWSAALIGSYYAKHLDAAEMDNRITNVPWEPNLEVFTSWDLGIADSTAIWYGQKAKHEKYIRIIDYYESSGEGLIHYIKELKNKPYIYSHHYLPHDVKVRSVNSDGNLNSRLDVLNGHGLRPTVIGRLSVMDGIEAVRALIPRCYFDRGRCAAGLKLLRAYHRQFNSRTNDYHDRPHHGIESHCADAFRMLACGLRDFDNALDYAFMAKTGKMVSGQKTVLSDYNEFG